MSGDDVHSSDLTDTLKENGSPKDFFLLNPPSDIWLIMF
jgi:hypothetical protein